jgi:hypothetical protein
VTTATTTGNPLAVYTAEVERRGGETSITGNYGAEGLKITDTADGLYLLHAEGFRAYSRQHGCHWTVLSYLCGTEDGQLWAVRVPGTHTTVWSALAWLEPAAVRRARAAGKQVWRQGDLYAVGTTRAHDGKGELPDRHAWDPETRTLTHPQHPALRLPDPVRFVQQRVYGMGRGAGRAGGD